MLLECEDLKVEHGQLMVRTITGPRPVSVLWRRLDSAFADPLELDHRSALGTPGMVGAMRDGNVTMANALGSGVLEARAFLAFLPAIARKLLGEPLRLPNIATWWCGQRRELDYVKANTATHDDRPGAVRPRCRSRSTTPPRWAAPSAGCARTRSRPGWKRTAPIWSDRRR